MKTTITNICKISGISRQTLYNRPEIIKKIKDLQKQSKCSCHLIIERLTAENIILRKELLKMKTDKFEF
jgi:ACT domain-containing protein